MESRKGSQYCFHTQKEQSLDSLADTVYMYLLSACYQPDCAKYQLLRVRVCSDERLRRMEETDFNNNISKYVMTNWEKCSGEKKHCSIGAFTKYPPRLGMSQTQRVACTTASSLSSWLAELSFCVCPSMGIRRGILEWAQVQVLNGLCQQVWFSS